MRFHLKAVGKAGVVSMSVEAQGDSEARRMVAIPVTANW